MDALYDFLTFSDPNIATVLWGNVLLAGISGLIGVLAFFQKKSLTTDAVSHAILPGVCIGFLLAGKKDPVFLVGGAMVTGLIAILLVDRLSRSRSVKIDTAITLVLSTFFGLGIFLLTIIQHQASGSQSGLDKFLFGRAAAMLEQDLYVYAGCGVIALALTLLFYRQILYTSFDAGFMEGSGLKTRNYQTLVSVLLVIAVVIGLQSVGVVLMAAMIIAPVATARAYTERHKKLAILATCFGLLSGFIGVTTSYIYPNLPTGPAIVISLTTIALLSLLLSPQYGYISAMLKRYRLKRKVQAENMMKLIFRSIEREPGAPRAFSASDQIFLHLAQDTPIAPTLSRLARNGMLIRRGMVFELSDLGEKEGERVTRLHRLWEVFLTQAMNIAPDHVHENAESIEHLITPEIEKKLQAFLGNPSQDPHKRPLPK
jgi:manganese/zinc/iron transport system permease protein